MLRTLRGVWARGAHAMGPESIDMRNYPPTETDECALCTAEAVTVAGYRGVAFYVRGHPVKTEWVEEMDGDETVYLETETLDAHRVIVVMVGDDRRHEVNVDDCTVLPREDYCGECGQIGCTHDGLTRPPESEV